MFRSVSLAMTVLAAGLTFGSSVGVYAPTIVPVDTLKPDEWKKYQPAALGSNTTGKIQAFYDMMCERVDLMSADYEYAADKRAQSFSGCPGPSARAAIRDGLSFPYISSWLGLYQDMCNWLSSLPTSLAVSSDSAYIYPVWQSGLCHDVAIRVTDDGIVSYNTDIYPSSLNKFGYAGTASHGISNKLATVAATLGIGYESSTNGYTASDIDDRFCRFAVSGTTNSFYVCDIDNAAGYMEWAPIYAFDRVCADVASRNVSVIDLTSVGWAVETEQRTTIYRFSVDTNEFDYAVMSMYDAGDVVISVYPTVMDIMSVTVTNRTTTTPWASASAYTTLNSAVGYINTIDGVSTVQMSQYPSIYVKVVSETSVASIGDTGVACVNASFINHPEYFDEAKVTVAGKCLSMVYMAGENGVMQTTFGTNAYYSTTTASSPIITDAINVALSNSFVLASDDIPNLLANVTSTVGAITLTLSDTTIGSSFANSSAKTRRITRGFGAPYVICENKYNFTEWSGHVAETTDAMATIGPRNDYEVGTIDAWVDASAASGGDGSSANPFQTIDEAITAVNPSGGTITKSGNVARIGIRPGTYTSPDFWNVYGMSSSWPHPAYNVQLVGVGEGVTINRDSKYITGYFEYLREQSSTVYLTNALSTVENVTFNMNSTNKRQIFLCLTFKSCKITGYMSFRNGGFASCNLYDCLLDDLTISKYSYQDTPGLAFFNGANCENCIIKLNSTQADAYVANNLSELTNCVLQVAQSRIQAETSTPGEYVFIDSTIQASNGVDTTTYPLSAENCIFFVDGMTENATYATGNIVTNSSLFSEVIDTHTYMPNDEYWQWRTHGFQTGARTE